MKKISLTNSQKFAVVDNCDYSKVFSRKWLLDPQGYARTTDRPVVVMHALLAGLAPIGKEVDHRNGNKLDNRRNNLRHATHSQNNLNGKLRANNNSGFIGVFWDNCKRKWRTQLNICGKQRTLGYFSDLETAARERDRAAYFYHGSFVRLNFPIRRFSRYA